MLGLYGLVQASPDGGSSVMSLDELLGGLRQGNPAIAGMRYAYQNDLRYMPAGGRGLYNHFVIVYQLDQADGQERLWVMNPHRQVSATACHPEPMSVEQFKRSWAFNNDPMRRNTATPPLPADRNGIHAHSKSLTNSF
jgi:hypothetical protein